MKWTAQEYDDQPSEFLSDLLYYYRTQGIIKSIESSEIQELINQLRNQQ